jgi:hypothetical protein
MHGDFTDAYLGNDIVAIQEPPSGWLRKWLQTITRV